MKNKLVGKCIAPAFTVLVLAGVATADPVYDPLHFEFSEICREGEDILQCTERRMRITENVLTGRSGIERARDHLLTNPDIASDTAWVLPELMRLNTAEITDRRYNLARGAEEAVWVVLFYAHVRYVDRVNEARFLLTRLAKQQFSCEKQLTIDSRACNMLREAGIGDAEFLAQRIGYMEALLAERTIEFEALVENYSPE